MALVDSTFYVDSVAYTAVAQWSNNGGLGTAYTAGQLRRTSASPAVDNERVWVCTVAGTGSTTTDSMNTTFTRGNIISDGATVKWQECTGLAGLNGNTADTAVWTVSTTWTLGQLLYDSGTASLNICTVAGAGKTSGTPTWSATAGTVIVDNIARWTSLGLASNFGAYAAPHARLVAALAATWAQAGNKIYVGDDHAETQSAVMTLTNPGTQASPISILCVDHTKANPVAADLKTTATVTTTATSSGVVMNIFSPNTYSGAYVYGITFQCSGVGGSANSMSIGTGALAGNRFDSCSFQLLNSTTAQTLTMGTTTFGTNRGNYIEWNNCTYKVAHVGAGIDFGLCHFRWRNTPSAIAGSTFPTTLFAINTGGADIQVDGVDLSALASGKALTNQVGAASTIVFRDCQINSAVTITNGSAATQAASLVSVVRTDSSGLNYRLERYNGNHAQVVETTAIRTGGATDGTTGVSWKIVTGSDASWSFPYRSYPIAKWNSTITPTSVTVTLYGIINAAAVPNNDELWIEEHYLGTSGAPISTIVNSSKATILTSNQGLTADSTSAWDSIATARANTHAYTTGDIIKVASNPGRLFFCTSGGTSTSPEPSGGSGYSSAVDGGSVTDGGATFRAGCRFSIALTFSAPKPQLAGYIYTYFMAGKATTTYYVDPLPVYS